MTGERSEYTGREVVAEIPAVDVYTSDQDKIGRVLEIGPEWVIVDRAGLFSGGNLWIPANRVSGDPQQGAIYVDCTKDQLDDMGWDQEPEMRDGQYVASDTSSSNDGDYAGTAYADRDRSSGDTSATSGGYTQTQDSYDTGTTGRDTDSERIRVHQEELQANKVAQEAGAVNVRKDVVEEQRELDVPVMREEVQVNRRPVSGDATADNTAFQETSDTIRVPIVEERVEVRKVPQVVEEIEISKRQVQDTQRVSDTVRREEVHVEEEGNASGSRGFDTTSESSTSYDETSGQTGSSDMGTVGENRKNSNF